MLALKEEYTNKRVSLITSKGFPLDVVLTNKLPQYMIEEIQLKWADWVEEIQEDETTTEIEETTSTLEE